LLWAEGVEVDQTLLWAEGVELDWRLLWAKGIDVEQTILWAEAVEVEQTLQQSERAGSMLLDETNQKSQVSEVWTEGIVGQNFQTEGKDTGLEKDCGVKIAIKRLEL
jgi:hypothetical protein